MVIATNAHPVPKNPSATTASVLDQANSESGPDQRRGREEDQRGGLRADEHRERPVPLLQRHGEVHRDAVEDDREQDQAGAERRGVGGPRRRPEHHHDAEEPDRDAGELAGAGGLRAGSRP